MLDSSATLGTALLQNLELARTDAERPRRVDLAYFAELTEANECYVAVRGGAGRVCRVPQCATPWLVFPPAACSWDGHQAGWVGQPGRTGLPLAAR